MNQSELQTIALKQLKALTDNSQQIHQAFRRDLEALSVRQIESEKQLTRLSELYTHLLPLIDSINSTINDKPR